MSVLTEVIAALRDEFRWRKQGKQESVAQRVAWLTTVGLALVFLAGAIGAAALRLVNRSADSS